METIPTDLGRRVKKVLATSRSSQSRFKNFVGQWDERHGRVRVQRFVKDALPERAAKCQTYRSDPISQFQRTRLRSPLNSNIVRQRCPTRTRPAHSPAGGTKLPKGET